MTISKDKTYKTRDGREVRIYATDGCPGYAIHGAVRIEAGWTSEEWYHDGQYSTSIHGSGNDLIEVKPRIKRTVWINVRDCDLSLHDSFRNAETYHQAHQDKVLACVKIEIDCDHGEGLDDE
ncbi:MAG: hypothetical protein JKY52_08495 [Flavobacteriales bacterium]|nr:hypothetical protein [Flavobacteriales bacterium]